MSTGFKTRLIFIGVGFKINHNFYLNMLKGEVVWVKKVTGNTGITLQQDKATSTK